MRRREFITFFGSAAAAWPLVARAQQAPGYPVVGFLSSDAPAPRERRFSAFRQGLSEVGYSEGRNVAFEYRFSEEHLEQLPALAADLVHRGVALIFASPTPAVTAAKVSALNCCANCCLRQSWLVILSIRPTALLLNPKRKI
jgi:putative ABC transport system substrate-binding protein